MNIVCPIQTGGCSPPRLGHVEVGAVCPVSLETSIDNFELSTPDKLVPEMGRYITPP